METNVKIRYTRLNQVCTKALQQSVNKIDKWEKLASCFPGYVSTENGSANLRNCQRQVVDFWKELCKREFEEIFKEREVEEKLNDLDELIFQAKNRLKTNSSTSSRISIDKLTPEQLISGNLHESRQKALEELNSQLEKIDKMNELLRNEILRLNGQIDEELSELHVTYDKTLTPESVVVDGTLKQGLRDMLLELEEST